jgi:DNA-binding Lrp family transcriptional regulator
MSDAQGAKLAHDLDETDRRLLALIQRDATLTAQALGERLNLSASQAARRRQRLEAEGIVRATRAVLDPQRLGLGVEAFIQVVMATHTEANARDFASLTLRQPEIVGAWTLTGEADYLLRVYCGDLAALNRLVQGVLLPHPAVSRVQSQIVMDRIKPDAPLPL